MSMSSIHACTINCVARSCDVLRDAFVGRLRACLCPQNHVNRRLWEDVHHVDVALPGQLVDCVARCANACDTGGFYTECSHGMRTTCVKTSHDFSMS